MLIGKDYPALEMQFYGLQLSEPNAFLGDLLIFVLCLSCAYKIRHGMGRTKFYKDWYWFFLITGISFFLGGLGHLLYHYLELSGKIPSWFLAIVACFFVERAMLSYFPKLRWQKILLNFARGKALLALLLEFIIIYVYSPVKQEVGLLVPAIDTGIGFIFCLGTLALYYQRHLDLSFRYIWLGVLLLIPTAFIQSFKLNPSPYFDRNDLSHLLILLSFALFYLGLDAYHKSQSMQSKKSLL